MEGTDGIFASVINWDKNCARKGITYPGPHGEMHPRGVSFLSAHQKRGVEGDLVYFSVFLLLLCHNR